MSLIRRVEIQALVGSTWTNLSGKTQDGVTGLLTVPGHNPADHAFFQISETSWSADTGYMLIDLSDSSAWPHTNTGQVDIEALDIMVNPSLTFAGDIKVGFLTNVDGDNGDFNYVYTWHMGKKQDSYVDHLRFGDGRFESNTDHWYGPIEANSTLWRTAGANILGPDGSTSHPCGNGDIVLWVDWVASDADISIYLSYHTDP